MVNKSPEEIAKLIEKAIKIIPEKHIHFAADLWIEIGISETAGYAFGINENESIRGLLEEERKIIKRALRIKWYHSDNPTLQICLYRLLATVEEHEALNQSNKYQHNVDGKVGIEGKIEITDKNYQKLKNEFEEKLKGQLIDTIKIKDENRTTG